MRNQLDYSFMPPLYASFKSFMVDWVLCSKILLTKKAIFYEWLRNKYIWFKHHLLLFKIKKVVFALQRLSSSSDKRCHHFINPLQKWDRGLPTDLALYVICLWHFPFDAYEPSLLKALCSHSFDDLSHLTVRLSDLGI